jgi:hypothetical protein
MCFSENTGVVNFDDLESRLRDKVLLDELTSNLESLVKNSKDSNGSSFADLISEFDGKISIKIISNQIIKPDCEQHKSFFVRSTQKTELLAQCWCLDKGRVVRCSCEE